MGMMKIFLLLLFCIIMLVGCIIGLTREIKEIKKIKMKPSDDNIKATVVGYNVAYSGDIHPILQYNVNGIEKKYICHFYYSSKRYPIGKEIILKLSNENALAYDREDLIKAFLLKIFYTGVSFFAVFFIVYAILSEV